VRHLVISDVHANLEALEAVLEAAPDHEAVLFLGDLVGYGPNPNECVDLVRRLPGLTALVGNHDLAALGLIDSADFNDVARAAALWTGEQLTDESRSFLSGLKPALSQGEIYLAHASPRDPVWEYMESPGQGPPNFARFKQRTCFVGHTHIPRVFEEPSGVRIPRPGESLALHAPPRRIVNPGGVGQPRDHDPRAAYGIFDAETGGFAFRRVPYDIAGTQQKILAAGLPAALASRLELGA